MASQSANLVPDPAQLTDTEILAEVLAGNIDCYEGIMRHHNQRMYRIARSIVKDDAEAMDVVQETFITAFNRLSDLKTPAALPGWLARIARNTALMRLRKSQRMQYMDEPDFENVLNLSATAPARPTPDSKLANRELGKLLEKCIDELPDAFRAVFVLRAVEHCSVSETADIMDLQKATVRTRFHRARLLLQEKVMDHCDVEGISVHEFAGHRCDAIVQNVMQRLRAEND